MGKYDCITRLIDQFPQNHSYSGKKGNQQLPIGILRDFHTDSLNEYVDQHPEEHLRSYFEIVEKAGLKRYLEHKDGENENSIPVEKLDGHSLVGLLIFLYRQDRFCSYDGSEYLKLFTNGFILRCLKRLKELDDLESSKSVQ
ncbi:DUF6508 domain-containing protein [Ileibacterium valens]|uniref:DUF6508 domain-containing protein n=1 Tax=Ileibacterium valens TaxID=1862668 RepID=UPI001177810D|nr:DUF6508 domain-containing protein [Ileibacterium valens]